MTERLDLQALQQNRKLLDEFHIEYQKILNLYMYRNEDFMIEDWLNEEIGRLKNYCGCERNLYGLENTNLLIYYCCLVSYKYSLDEVPF